MSLLKGIEAYFVIPQEGAPAANASTALSVAFPPMTLASLPVPFIMAVVFSVMQAVSI